MTTLEDLMRIALDHSQVVALERAGVLQRRLSAADRRALERDAKKEAARALRVVR